MRSRFSVLLALGGLIALSGCPVALPPAGQIASACRAADDCGLGQLCQDGRCRAVASDAGVDGAVQLDAAELDALAADRVRRDALATDRLATDRLATDQAALDRLAPDQAASDRAAFDQATSDRALADQIVRDQAISDRAINDQTVPDQAVPDQVLPDLARPDQAQPDRWAPDAAAATWPGGFAYRKSLTVDYQRVDGTQDLVDYPLLVDLRNDADLAAHVRSAQAWDLVFRLDGAPDDLPVEIERWDGASGSLIAWVKVPLLLALANTVLYLYYGNAAITAPTTDPTAVWDSNYVVVYHLNDAVAAGSTIRDSTANHIDGVAQNMEGADRVAGVIGRGVRLDAADEEIRIDDARLDLGSSLTIEAWGRMDGAGGSYQRLYQKGTGNYSRYTELYVYDELTGATGQLRFRLNQDSPGSTGEVAQTISGFGYGTWYAYAAVFDDTADSMSVLVDGSVQGSVDYYESPDVGQPNSACHIGNWDNQATNTRYWNGVLDEWRLSSIARSSSWLATEYNNQSDPGSFFSVGAAETP